MTAAWKETDTCWWNCLWAWRPALCHTAPCPLEWLILISLNWHFPDCMPILVLTQHEHGHFPTPACLTLRGQWNSQYILQAVIPGEEKEVACSFRKIFLCVHFTVCFPGINLFKLYWSYQWTHLYILHFYMCRKTLFGDEIKLTNITNTLWLFVCLLGNMFYSIWKKKE